MLNQELPQGHRPTYLHHVTGGNVQLRSRGRCHAVQELQQGERRTLHLPSGSNSKTHPVQSQHSQQQSNNSAKNSANLTR
jgi:hypothetical protein